MTSGSPVDAVDATEVLDRPDIPRRQRIVIVGVGFAGYYALARLTRKLTPAEAEILVISDSDGTLYQPLLPEVAVGTLDPRTILVPISDVLGHAHLIRGRATAVDVERRTVAVESVDGGQQHLRYDRLVLTAGSVTRLLAIPGLADHAVGFKTAAESLYVRDLVLRRMEAANDEPDSDRRRRLLSFVVVGAGYAGTELVAQMARLTDRLLRRFPVVDKSEVDWKLLDMAPAVMPELGGDLGARALEVLSRRGVDVRLRTSLDKLTDDGAHLTDGTFLPGAAVLWCAGVTPSPVVATAGLPVAKGRLVVNTDFTVPGHGTIYAAGDAAAVPDLSKKRGADGDYPVCPPTAQHAMRQGRRLAKNIIADVRSKRRRNYRHRDLGLVVDLGGLSAVARPLGVPLTGFVAMVVTRGYHLLALPSMRRKLRTATGWLLAGGTPDDVTIGISAPPASLAEAEHPVAGPEADRPSAT